MSNFLVTDHGDMDLSAAMLVVGFPGTGYVGTIATSFLVESMGLQKVASIMSDSFPPMAVVRDGRAHSPMRVYAAPMVCGLDGKCNQLAVLASEVAPRPEHAYDLARTLLSWAKGRKVRQVVCLEGTRVEGGPEAMSIYGVAAGAGARARVEAMKLAPLREGVVSGFPGALLQVGEATDTDVLCLLAATHGEVQDAHAAARTLELLKPLLPKLTLDIVPLHAQAEAMDRQLRRIVERHQETMNALSEQSRFMYG